MRIPDHPILGPAPERRTVTFTWNGRPMQGLEGEPLAAALLAGGERILRHSDRLGLGRGIYCNIGHCYECMVVVDGVHGRRACLTPLREGMAVERQEGVAAPGSGTLHGQLVCRCEEVTLERLDELAAGSRNVEEVKRYSRITMGPCQGRVCRPLLVRLRDRFPATPVGDAPGAGPSIADLPLPRVERLPGHRPPVRTVRVGDIAALERTEDES